MFHASRLVAPQETPVNARQQELGRQFYAEARRKSSQDEREIADWKSRIKGEQTKDEKPLWLKLLGLLIFMI